MKGNLVNLDNLFPNCRVKPSDTMPQDLINTLILRKAAYGITNKEKIVWRERTKKFEIETRWYDVQNRFITKFWHTIDVTHTVCISHLIHDTNGEFNLEETMQNLDELIRRL